MQKTQQVINSDVTIPALPLCDAKLTRKICQLIQQLLSLHQIKKGTNEVLKELTRSRLEVVIIAADCEPRQVVMMLPPLCQQKNVRYCFVKSKAVLGRVCGIKRPTGAVGITFKEDSPLNNQILELKDKIEQLGVAP